MLARAGASSTRPCRRCWSSTPRCVGRHGEQVMYAPFTASLAKGGFAFRRQVATLHLCLVGFPATLVARGAGEELLHQYLSVSLGALHPTALAAVLLPCHATPPYLPPSTFHLPLPISHLPPRHSQSFRIYSPYKPKHPREAPRSPACPPPPPQPPPHHPHPPRPPPNHPPDHPPTASPTYAFPA